jgi:hypothetical protein
MLHYLFSTHTKRIAKKEKDELPTCAIIRDVREVSLGVKGDGLVARVVTRHIALAAVDAHVLLRKRHTIRILEINSHQQSLISLKRKHQLTTKILVLAKNVQVKKMQPRKSSVRSYFPFWNLLLERRLYKMTSQFN